MFDNFFENVGEKIKRFVKFFAVLGMLFSIILSVVGVILSIGNILLVILVIIIGLIGFFGSWVSAWAMYGYGELIQRLINIDNKLNVNKNKTSWTKEISLNRVEPIKSKGEEFKNNSDKEILYQFALEKIEKKQYQFARDALKRILGYKDSEELLTKIGSM